MALLGVMSSFIGSIYYVSIISWALGLGLSSSVAFSWFRDVVREATFQGDHTAIVQRGIRMGIAFFITSEVLLFFSLFWGYIHRSLSVLVSSGGIWPFRGLSSLEAFQLPILNTAILLSRGVSITLAHHSLILGHTNLTVLGLSVTIILGLYFIGIQGLEYMSCSFSLSDGAFGSSFFMVTSAHGMHVIVGCGMLIVSLLRQLLAHFVQVHHFGFEAGAWYWHFVDVVWLILFLLIYWWGRYRGLSARYRRSEY